MKLWPFGKKQKRSLEDPNKGISYADIFGFESSASGEIVSPSTVMKVSAALSCVRVLAESIASLSWILYERLPGGGKVRAQDHHVYDLIHNRPNPIMSSFNFRERKMKDLLLEGNFYALIDWNNYGEIEALWPLNPRNVTVKWIDSGRDVVYVIKTSNGFDGEYRRGEIFHVASLGDGIVGKSVISYNAESFGLAMSQDRFASAFFANGAYAGGVLESDKSVTDDAQKRLKAGWQHAYGRSGPNEVGWHRIAVLEDGLKWKPMTVNPKDAMILESRKFQIADIARMFRVPPHMIADLDRATYSNIEHQSLEFVIHTLRPWAIRIEQEANYKLLLPAERNTYLTEFLMDSMLRGDVKSRNEAYAIMRQNGVINADEWRERENLNPLPGSQGKKYIVMSNMQELSKVGKEIKE
jgi:HK97 family phage portal protein